MNESIGGNPIRKHVIFRGHVQGVCFRMTAAQLSEGFDVTGYVRNLPDGSVELEAQGTAAEVEGFLASIGREFKANIRGAEANPLPPRSGETNFRITY